MTTRPYSECLDLALALVGVPDANTQEVSRVKAFINGRAKKAYAASRYWPRFLTVGEERIVSEDGLLPYTETGLSTIKQVLRIHATEPFKDLDALEYTNFTAKSDGILITGYRTAAYTGFGPILVQGTISPESDGTYHFTGMGSAGLDGETAAPQYARLDNPSFTIIGSVSFAASVPPLFLGYYYQVRSSASDYWQSGTNTAYTTPDLADGTYTAVGAAIDEGSVSVTAVDTYSAWVTYKMAFSTTYGDGDGEEPDMPEEWWEYCAWGARADFLRNDGQDEKAAAFAEREAQEKLDDQLMILDQQAGSHVFTRVLSHSNTQAR